jgi:hypothetical protein
MYSSPFLMDPSLGSTRSMGQAFDKINQLVDCIYGKWKVPFSAIGARA